MVLELNMDKDRPTFHNSLYQLPKRHDAGPNLKWLTSEIANLDPLGSDDRLLIPLEVLGLFSPQSQSDAMLRLVNQRQISLRKLFPGIQTVNFRMTDSLIQLRRA
jgi:hypothetical protein